MKAALSLAGALGIALLLLAGPTSARAQAPPSAGEQDAFRVLVYSRTTGFRHSSIPAGIAAIRKLGSEHGFAVDATEDAAAFTDANLRRYAAVIFLNTTGTLLDTERQRGAFDRYVTSGGGFVGVHSAADGGYEWPFYGGLVGTYFKSHPLEQTAELVTEDRDHPATAHLPGRFTVFDEFYSFRTNPRPDVHVLLNIDESTYSPDPNTTDLPGGDAPPSSGVMGDHPMSWCHDVGRGRSFYTALGHELNMYVDDRFLLHLLGGIRTAARRVAADCGTAAPAGPPGGRPCFTAASEARKKRIGRAGLGNRRASVRRTFAARGGYRRFMDRYCLDDGSTIRVGYPSHKQLRRLVRRERRRLRGKASLVLTTSRRSTVRGINVGDSRLKLLRRTGRRRGVRVGANVWYVRRGERAGHVFKVREGIVREVGLADRKQTATNRRVKRFFTSDR